MNGKRVDITDGANALSLVLIEAGENQIELKYYIPGMKEGVILTALGIVMFVGIVTVSRRKRLK